MIKTENPDISDDQMAFSIAELKEHEVVDSGDTLNLGIGAMTDARWKDFFDKMRTEFESHSLANELQGVGLFVVGAAVDHADLHHPCRRG